MELPLIENLVLIVHVLAALAVIGLVLVQHGKGADMGSGFGGGASSTVFGSGGAGNFLTRMTTTLAVVFFLTSFGLAFFAKQHSAAATDLGIPQVMEEQITPDLPDLPELGTSDDPELPVLELDAPPSSDDSSAVDSGAGNPADELPDLPVDSEG